MKKCPTCESVFDDSLKFCQIDGTPLVSSEQSVPDDSFKTMVGTSISDYQKESSWDDSTESSARNVSPPSPFQQTQNSEYDSPFTPSFKEAEPRFDEPQSSFNQSSYGSPTEWTPPPAPVSQWQSQDINANTPFQPPAFGQGEDKTLALVSLVCGILSVTCCGAFTGIVALITGFMAKNNVDANPQQYGGRGMAIAGMIMGAISLVLTILIVLGGVLG